MAMFAVQLELFHSETFYEGSHFSKEKIFQLGPLPKLCFFFIFLRL